MKKAFKKYAENRISVLKYRMNSMDETAKADAQAVIDQLTTLVADMDAAEEEYATKDVLDEMKKSIEDKIAALAENTDTTTENSLKAKTYLESENALHDFAQSIRMSRNAATFSKKWNEKLSQNGISGTVVFPTVVLGMIQDAWEKKSWIAGLKNTGAKAYKVRYNTSTQSNETSRAKGHTPGHTKVEQTLAFASKDVTPQMIYKIMKLDNIVEFNDDGSLVKYIVDELTNQWIYEAQMAILVGDGRSSSSNDKINSVEAIVRSESDTFVTVSAHTTGAEKIAELRALRDTMAENGGKVVAFMSRATKTEIAKFLYAGTGTTRYSSDEEICGQIGVDEIITTNVLGTKAEAVLLNLDAYVTVGEFNPAFANWEDFDNNLQCYRIEAPFGGAMEMPNGAAVLTPAAS